MHAHFHDLFPAAPCPDLPLHLAPPAPPHLAPPLTLACLQRADREARAILRPEYKGIVRDVGPRVGVHTRLDFRNLMDLLNSAHFANRDCYKLKIPQRADDKRAVAILVRNVNMTPGHEDWRHQANPPLRDKSNQLAMMASIVQANPAIGIFVWLEIFPTSSGFVGVRWCERRLCLI